MYISYNKYLYNVYSSYLKNKDLFFILNNKSLNHKNNFNFIKRNWKLNLVNTSLNKHLFIVNILNSIFSSTKNIQSAKIGIAYFYKQYKIDFRTLDFILHKNTIFLMKLYNRFYILPQLKYLRSLNYNYNLKVCLSYIKYFISIFLNTVKINFVRN